MDERGCSALPKVEEVEASPLVSCDKARDGSQPCH